MNKIGFRIYRFKEGPSVGLTVNEGDWTKKVVDIRDILKLYNSEDESKFAMFMSFSENGAYITIARAISGRGGDNTAAWIYIPNNIEVTGNDIIPIIEVVKEELSASKSNVERLTQIFNKDYRTTESADYMPSSSEKIFAKRDVGFYPLKDIIGEKRYQPIYSNYNVILIKDMDGMEIVDKNITDLSSEKMVETLVFCPPVKQDLPNGVTVHFNTSGYPLFNKPVRVYKSKHINLVFKRIGFEDIPYMDSVEENDQICGVPRFDWKKSISRDQFKVVAAHDSNVDLTDDATITVNNVELKWHQPILISEHDGQQAKVRFSVNGYEPAEEYIDLLHAATSITVKLHRAERAQSWKIELANGHTAVMDLRSKYLSGDKYESPIKGYSREDGVLRYTNFGVFKQRAIGFLMAVATFVVICLGVALFEWFDNHNFEWQLGWPPLKVEKIGSYKAESSTPTESYSNNDDETTPSDQSSVNEDGSLSKAIAYLDNEAGVWQRDSLIKYPELVGLFEELNSYEFSKILNRDSKLRESKNFKKICDAININSGKQFNGNFCGEGDYSITVSNYEKKLNKPVDQPKASANGGVASEAAKKAQKSSSNTPASQKTPVNNPTKEQKPKRGGV
ncbi:hypothetical protein [uncultured Muribaculum sp.]|uniref:hypothetical protein n=1 Tax=uncultured Muribaculum sp. TaxID=1918613 RepID=UPI0025B78FCC|nr:hypothetical protein [uncultured Muribaculum sp.]